MKRITHLIITTFFLTSALANAAMDPEVKKWRRAGFAHPEISTITIPVATTAEAISSQPVTHILDGIIVLFRNTGWTKEVIEAHLKRTNEIYAQCGIRMGEFQFIESDAFQGKLDIQERWNYDGDDLLISKATPAQKRPVIYLMRDILPGNSGAREGAFTNIVNFWVPLAPIAQNTIWISNIINNESYGQYHDMTDDGKSVLKTRDPSYNVVAHEIAHLLADMGHETELKEKNLLNGSSELLGEHLLPRQCERFKKSPMLRPNSP